jgi:hypothetical protein
MNPVIKRMLQEQEVNKINYIDYLNSFIGKEFIFKNVVYTIEGVSENLQNFIFCDVLELSTKTVINNIVESMPCDEGFEERNAFLSMNY